MRAQAAIDGAREQITAIFENRVTTQRTPGSFFAMFGPDGIVFEQGFGETVLGEGVVPHRDTVFRIASCTKSFTCTMLLILRDRGQLNLDAPITDFVPAFRALSPAAAPVTPTVRMLMTMSAGFVTDNPWGDRMEEMTRAELNDFVAVGVSYIATPGTGFEYSNLGYALLGEVIAEVTGLSYVDAVSTEILTPLGLTSTRFDRDPSPDTETALGYRLANGAWAEQPITGPGMFSAMGGLFSTATDIVRWSLWLARALDPEDSSDGPLSSASRRELQQIQRVIPKNPLKEAVYAEPTAHGYGYGLFIDEGTSKIVSHSGGYPGYSAHMRWHAPSGLGIVAFENGTFASVAVPATQALQGALNSYGDLSVPAAAWPETLAARDTFDGLVRNWDTPTADAVAAVNLALDVPYGERIAAIATAVAKVGPLTGAPLTEVERKLGDTPAMTNWTIEGERGRITCHILMSPELPPRVQTFKLETESH
ncbi:CubicO group peptidase (beta-lactamase class C family) [Rhodoglobus vestalii]|uniref:CubicO group peptidase (Beta-lactamase class C family) n=1 Tax=Rhodoglobus vestalii TaxID=193384 RepID=A0A8H2K512_9MICO|nr:serine hydrolase domain-containing protein [Rhodoglobus vestalii]TQO20280.1 CubicO group peptidase (beta-lactamase class C family) [Rhodoglobus vestalii]